MIRSSDCERRWAAVDIVHPLPSLLVTATFLAVVSIALHAVPPAWLCLRLVGLMLPAQSAIGVVNDLADFDADRAAQPCKPLVTGAISAWPARLLALACITMSIACALTLNRGTLIGTIVGLAAGIGYDVSFKRNVFSGLPWVLGFSALPVTAFAAVGRAPHAMISLIAIAALLAVGLHCANALPDIDGDRRNGIRSLPVTIGVDRTRFGAALLATLAAVSAVMALPRTGISGLATLLGAGVLSVSAPTLAVLRVERPFPIQAIASAVFAISCLISVG